MTAIIEVLVLIMLFYLSGPSGDMLVLKSVATLNKRLSGNWSSTLHSDFCCICDKVFVHTTLENV